MPALTIRGFLQQPLIVQGAVTKQMFECWLLQCVIPQLEPGSIIIMDNASIHRNLNEDVTAALRIKDMRIEYLPPYSPDFNPIENTFHVLKDWIKRNFDLQFMQPSFRAFIGLAIASAIGTDMRAFFRHCHYSV